MAAASGKWFKSIVNHSWEEHLFIPTIRGVFGQHIHTKDTGVQRESRPLVLFHTFMAKQEKHKRPN